MINLRYHIISITAVFLALGIGLALGTSFLDRVTVDTLKQQLDDVEERVQETDAQNSALAGRVERLQERDLALAGGVGRLVEDRLSDVPVLVLTSEGTDQADVDAAVATLSSSGAQVTGSWRLTDRWGLEGDDDVTALADALGITSDDPERLYQAGTARLAQLLLAAEQPPVVVEEPPADDPSAAEGAEGDEAVSGSPEGDNDEASAPEGQDEGTSDDTAEVIAVDPPAEPELLASLVGAGFIEYQPLPGSGDERVLLPAADVRYVVVSSAPTPSAPERALTTVVTAMADEAAVAVLVAQGESNLTLADGTPASEDDRRTTFVGALRAAEGVRERISTLDNLDTASGLLAMVLAVEDLGADVVGHYGVTSSAAALVPGSPAP